MRRDDPLRDRRPEPTDEDQPSWAVSEPEEPAGCDPYNTVSGGKPRYKFEHHRRCGRRFTF